MAEIYLGRVRAKAKSAKRPGSVREKRVRNSEGEIVRVLSLDANSATFIDSSRESAERFYRMELMRLRPYRT